MGTGTGGTGMEIWRKEESLAAIFRVSPSAQPFPSSRPSTDAGVWSDSPSLKQGLLLQQPGFDIALNLLNLLISIIRAFIIIFSMQNKLKLTP